MLKVTPKWYTVFQTFIHKAIGGTLHRQIQNGSFLENKSMTTKLPIIDNSVKVNVVKQGTVYICNSFLHLLMFKQQKTSDSEAKITVVCRESLSAGVPGKLCCTLSNSSLVQLVTSGRISGLFMFHLPLHEAFWLLLIKALKSTFPIIISISESTTRFTTSKKFSNKFVPLG